MGTVFIIIVAVIAASAAFVGWHLWRAPYGYEDDRGFHLGDPVGSEPPDEDDQEAA